MEFWFVIFVSKIFTYILERCCHGCLIAGFYWSYQNCVETVCIIYKNIFISFERSDGKFSSEVCVNCLFILICYNAAKQNNSQASFASFLGNWSSYSLVDWRLGLLRMDRTFFLVLCRCPLTVAVEGERCFVTASLVRPGNPRSWSSSIAFTSVDLVGENKH